MIWLLVFGVLLVIAGSFTAGVASADRARGLWWALADRVAELRGPAPVYVPVYEDYVPVADAPPEHPRYGPLLTTPPHGIEVTRDDGTISVKADQPVQRVRADGDPFTGPVPKLTDELYAELCAERPPTIEELRRQYDSWQETVYGQAPVADVLAAEDGAQLPQVIA